MTRLWARRGSRPRAPRDTRYTSAYIFGAACPARGCGAALVLPRADTEAMNLHLAEISCSVAPGGVERRLEIAQAGLAGKLGIDHRHEMVVGPEPLAPFVTPMS